ncbi:hypothetical protein CYMTET_26515, partial [Cymbomonas tetramitiformis]
MLCCSVHTEAYKLKINANQRECVQEQVEKAGDSITGSFVSTAADAQKRRVFSGTEAFDFTVVDPAYQTIYTVRRKQAHKFDFLAKTQGTYTICFFNQGRVPGYVLYHAHVGGHLTHDRALE